MHIKVHVFGRWEETIYFKLFRTLWVHCIPCYNKQQISDAPRSCPQPSWKWGNSSSLLCKVPFPKLYIVNMLSYISNVINVLYFTQTKVQSLYKKDYFIADAGCGCLVHFYTEAIQTEMCQVWNMNCIIHHPNSVPELICNILWDSCGLLKWYGPTQSGIFYFHQKYQRTRHLHGLGLVDYWPNWLKVKCLTPTHPELSWFLGSAGWGNHATLKKCCTS